MARHEVAGVLDAHPSLDARLEEVADDADDADDE